MLSSEFSKDNFYVALNEIIKIKINMMIWRSIFMGIFQAPTNSPGDWAKEIYDKINSSKFFKYLFNYTSYCNLFSNYFI